MVKGKGVLTLTGHLGDVMKESAQAALSYVRSRDRQLGIKPGVFAKHDIHVHVPAGAIPKDGPSAGITMATALASAFTNTPVRHDIAMTGEVTLRGRVLQIGGLKEKILAAKRVGIFTVILPKKNEKDLADIPKHLLKGMTFIDRKSTRLNSSHGYISYAVFCLKKKKKIHNMYPREPYNASTHYLTDIHANRSAPEI